MGDEKGEKMITACEGGETSWKKVGRGGAEEGTGRVGKPRQGKMKRAEECEERGGE